MKRTIMMAICLAMMLTALLCGCATGKNAKMGGMVNTKAGDTREDEEHNALISGDGYPYTITDYLNREFILEEPPENWAVLSGTFINLWYRLGGKSICTTDLGSAFIDESYADEIMELPLVGAVYNPNIEKVAELDPAFTIAQVGIQTTLAGTMNEMGKPAALFHMRSYNDVLDHIRIFGKLLQNDDEAEAIISRMEADKKAITDKLPEESKSVVIMYVTSSSLAVKLDNSIAGDVANILGLENIASGLLPDTLGSETTPLDVEYIAQQNPDIILVTSMISSNEDAKRVMNEEFYGNPVWETVGAVNEGNVVYLPQEYFLYNAGHKYVKAIEYMAKGVYPEIFGALDE